MPRSNSSKQRISRGSSMALVIATLAISLSLILHSSIPCIEALTLPSFRIEEHVAFNVQNGVASNQRQRHYSRKNKTQMSLTIDDVVPSGLWKIRSNNDGSRRSNNSRQSQQDEQLESLGPFGPVPRGGSLADIVIPNGGGGAAVMAMEQPRQNPLSRVRTGVKGVRRRLLSTTINLNGVFRGNKASRAARSRDVANSSLFGGATVVNNAQRLVINTNINGHSVLRVGGMINRRLRRRRAAQARAATSTVGASVSGSKVLAYRMETVDCLDVMGDIDAWTDMETALESSSSAASSTAAIEAVDQSDPLSLPIVGRLFQKRSSEEHQVIRTAYETASIASSASALSSRGGSSTAVAKSDSLSSSFSSSASVDMMDTYYVIETPLFPIILPKSFEPRTAAGTSSGSPAAATASITSLEISVAIEEVTYGTAVADVAEAKPSAHLMQAATQPLLAKSLLESFTGREFYYPESIEALAQTGMKMTLGQAQNEWVNWSGEKKTDKFLKDHGVDGMAGNTKEWYNALDSSQEVLVWAGKFSSKDGYGSELPIIKTTSIIHQSPRYLAELLMDSTMVKVYNKMSLGRTDEKVFQTGVDTLGGSFGDGESKVVRNLTKPPMVSSLLEFVTCMHARKLRPSDMQVLSPDDSINADEESSSEGYVVVSRAVTGGEWSTDNNSNDNSDKRVRNEILLGVNILKAVPGEPNKTELTAVTHVYSPMIPQMLAKNAGVKGAVDFVRDIRALP